MKYLILLLLCGIILNSHTQQELSFSFGGGLSYLQFKPFEDFTNSYNEQLSSTITKSLKYNPFGFEVNVGLSYCVNKLYSGLRLGTSKSFTSKAEFEDGSRNFNFRGYNFDIIAGLKFGKVITYFSMSLHSLNINTFYEFDGGIRSFGSDHNLSGVYTSSKMQGSLGLRFEEKQNKFGYFFDFLFPLNSRKYLGGTFYKQTNTTDAPFFPQENSNYGTLDSDLALPQSYRNIRLNIGFIYYLSINK